MTDRAAISGNYADFKLVKTRSVAQVIIEVPIEKAEAFLSLFGVPQPGAEKPVALALLNVPVRQGISGLPTMADREEKPKQSWSSMSRAQQAGILCADKQFQHWMGIDRSIGRADADDYAAAEVRAHCGVTSRAKLDADEKAAAKWDALVSKYRTATGQMAEQR